MQEADIGNVLSEASSAVDEGVVRSVRGQWDCVPTVAAGVDGLW